MHARTINDTGPVLMEPSNALNDYASGMVRSGLRNMRCELPHDKFLKDIYDRSFPGADQRVLEYQCRSTVFIWIVES